MNKVLTKGKCFFYPVLKCPRCETYFEGLCITCKDQLMPYDLDLSLKFMDGVSLYVLNQIANDLINAYKKKQKFSAGEAIVKLIMEKVGDEIKKVDFITVAPSSKISIKKLGFDHGAHLMKLLSNASGIPGILLFEPGMNPQKGVAKEESEANALGIQLKKGSLKKYKGKIVLILDDIFRTGNTLKRCTWLLGKEGIQSKYVIFSRL